MAINKTVLKGQSLMDFVLQHTGSLDYLVPTAKLNNISPTDNLVPGHILLVPEVETLITKYFETKSITIATEKLTKDPTGIGHMAIEVDFIVL